MCLISAHKPGTKPVEQHLLNGIETAPHGAGYAMVTEGRDGAPSMLFCKSLDSQMMLDQFLALREQFQDGWAVFWSRRATAGHVSVDNCQPFMVGEWNPETVLFHNGHLFDTLDPAASDSRVFARDLGARLDGGESLDDPETFARIDSLVSMSNSKVLVLNSHPRHAQPVYFFNASQWFTESGVSHSQPDYLGKGVGWDEMVMDSAPADPEHGQAGDVWRFNLPQPGMCANCNLLGHGEDGLHCELPRAKTPMRWRNESKNEREIAALAREIAGRR